MLLSFGIEKNVYLEGRYTMTISDFLWWQLTLEIILRQCTIAMKTNDADKQHNYYLFPLSRVSFGHYYGIWLRFFISSFLLPIYIVTTATALTISLCSRSYQSVLICQMCARAYVIQVVTWRITVMDYNYTWFFSITLNL